MTASVQLYNEEYEKNKKNDMRNEIVGNVNELIAYLGIILSLQHTSTTKPYLNIKSILTNIQHCLLEINSTINKDDECNLKNNIKQLDVYINDMSKKTNPLRQIILSGSNFNLLSSHIHVTQTISKKLEQNLWKLDKIQEVDLSILTYLNRLTEFFLVFARYTSEFKSEKQPNYTYLKFVCISLLIIGISYL